MNFFPAFIWADFQEMTSWKPISLFFLGNFTGQLSTPQKAAHNTNVACLIGRLALPTKVAHKEIFTKSKMVT